MNCNISHIGASFVQSRQLVLQITTRNQRPPVKNKPDKAQWQNGFWLDK